MTKGKNLLKERSKQIAAEKVVAALNGGKPEDLQRWANARPENTAALEESFETWSALEPLSDDEEILAMAKPRGDSHRPLDKSNVNPSNKWIYLAAACPLLIALAFLFYTTDKLYYDQHELISEFEEIKELSLSDKSLITLNANSKLKIDYSKDERRVHMLYGEAYFNVSKNKQRPFVIYHNNNRIEVVGTQFNVRLDDTKLHVAVLEGTVALTEGSKAANKVLLDSGNMAEADGDINTDIDITRIDKREKYLEWKKGILRYDNINLKRLASELQRFTPKKIIVSDEIGALPLTVVMQLDQIEDKLLTLEHILPIRVSINKETIEIDSIE